MRILPAKEMECRQRELRILILLALIVWIKFFVVDYMVADVLNWPSFGSMKAQFKKADASGAHCALIFGGDEMQRGMVTVKQLRDGAGAQAEYAIDNVAEWAAQLRG